MKVNVSVEATAQEMREFLGLPNVQPLHDDVMKALRDNVQRGVINFDALSLMKPLLPQFTSMEMVQKFWEAVAKASAQPAKDMAERKADNPPEPHDSDAARSGTEKSS
jgi:protoheme ferro-lyase